MGKNSNNFFSKDYQLKAHLQRSVNSEKIQEIVLKIKRWTLDKAAPIKILDLCCGSGESTYELLNVCTKANIKVELIDGYDISEEQIQVAQGFAKLNAKLHFYVQDVESMQIDSRYDLIISFFGFHWITNLENLATSIKRALKPNGHLFFLVPLEKIELFNLREKLINSKQWCACFKKFSIQALRYNTDEYMHSFARSLSLDSQKHPREHKYFQYTPEAFKTFLESWMPEVQYLKQIDKSKVDKYLHDLITQISCSPYSFSSLSREQDPITGNTYIKFVEQLCWCSATNLKSKELNSTDQFVMPDLTPLQLSLNGFFNSIKLTHENNIEESCMALTR
ncbi:MAG: hypothetical protein Tsb005_05440 [Gammaproteobacteria bacterium]